MQFSIPKTGENILNLMRRLGYRPEKNRYGEESFARPISGQPYPKFHIYIEETDSGWVLKLHLDQKKPSYEGSGAHSGEYEGPVVEQETERIKHIFGL